jgi:chitin disaccharide deacetylase
LPSGSAPEMGAKRVLIVNADDFGQDPGINAGVIEAHELGIVTSTSLMVCWPAAGEAADYARAQPALSVGLHLDLGQWTFAEGEWMADYERVPPASEPEVEREIRRQLELFQGLMRSDPTHIDSHQHVHLREPAASAARRLAEELDVVLRDRSALVRHCGGFYGQTGIGEPYPQGISVEQLVELIDTLPEGITELICHPGRGLGAEFVYGRERERELTTLCDPRVRAAIVRGRVQLSSFGGIRGARWGDA